MQRLLALGHECLAGRPVALAHLGSIDQLLDASVAELETYFAVRAWILLHQRAGEVNHGELLLACGPALR